MLETFRFTAAGLLIFWHVNLYSFIHSNLTFISKLAERVVHSRLQSHMNSINYKCDTQFGYKKFHATETLLVKLVNDLLIGLDQRNGVVLVVSADRFISGVRYRGP